MTDALRTARIDRLAEAMLLDAGFVDYDRALETARAAVDAERDRALNEIIDQLQGLRARWQSEWQLAAAEGHDNEAIIVLRTCINDLTHIIDAASANQ